MNRNDKLAEGKYVVTRMWANAQRDSRPAEIEVRPLLNAAVWLTPTTRVPCSNAANMGAQNFDAK